MGDQPLKISALSYGENEGRILSVLRGEQSAKGQTAAVIEYDQGLRPRPRVDGLSIVRYQTPLWIIHWINIQA